MNNIIRCSLVMAAFFAHTLSCSDSLQSNQVVEKREFKDAVVQFRPDQVISRLIKVGYLCNLQSQLGIHEQKAVANDPEKGLFLNQATDDYITDKGIENRSYVSRTLYCIDGTHCAMVMQHPIMSKYPPRIVIVESSK